MLADLNNVWKAVIIYALSVEDPKVVMVIDITFCSGQHQSQFKVNDREIMKERTFAFQVKRMDWMGASDSEKGGLAHFTLLKHHPLETRAACVHAVVRWWGYGPGR